MQAPRRGARRAVGVQKRPREEVVVKTDEDDDLSPDPEERDGDLQWEEVGRVLAAEGIAGACVEPLQDNTAADVTFASDYDAGRGGEILKRNGYDAAPSRHLAKTLQITKNCNAVEEGDDDDDDDDDEEEEEENPFVMVSEDPRGIVCSVCGETQETLGYARAGCTLSAVACHSCFCRLSAGRNLSEVPQIPISIREGPAETLGYTRYELEATALYTCSRCGVDATGVKLAATSDTLSDVICSECDAGRGDGPPVSHHAAATMPLSTSAARRKRRFRQIRRELKTNVEWVRPDTRIPRWFETHELIKIRRGEGVSMRCWRCRRWGPKQKVVRVKTTDRTAALCDRCVEQAVMQERAGAVGGGRGRGVPDYLRFSPDSPHPPTKRGRGAGGVSHLPHEMPVTAFGRGFARGRGGEARPPIPQLPVAAMQRYQEHPGYVSTHPLRLRRWVR